MGLKEGNN